LTIELQVAVTAFRISALRAGPRVKQILCQPAALVGAVLDAIADHPRALIDDFTELPVIYSTATQPFALLARKTARQDGQLRLTASRPDVPRARHPAGAILARCDVGSGQRGVALGDSRVRCGLCAGRAGANPLSVLDPAASRFGDRNLS